MPVVHISDAAASAREFGYSIVGRFRTALPVASDVGLIRFGEAFAYDSETPLPPDAERYLEAMLPKHPRGEAEADLDLVRAMLGHYGSPSTYVEYRQAIEDKAIPVALLPPSPERDRAAACTDALWPWGAGRDKFRRDVEEARARTLQATADLEAARIEAARPNRKTLAELGLVGVNLRSGSAPGSWPTWLAIEPAFGLGEYIRKSAMPWPGGHLVLFRARFDGDMSDGPIEGTACDIVTSYVPPRMPNVKPRALPWVVLDCRGADTSPMSGARDLRTAEGEKALEDFGARMKKHREAARAERDATERIRWARYAVQMARRAYGLRRELVAQAIAEVLGDGYVSQPRLEKLLDEAEEGTRAWFSPDECYAPPAATFVDRFVGLFSDDGKWKKVIERTTRARDVVTSAELEAAIVGAGLSGPFRAEEHERLHRLMPDWTKKQPTIDGQRVRAFVRGGK